MTTGVRHLTFHIWYNDSTEEFLISEPPGGGGLRGSVRWLLPHLPHCTMNTVYTVFLRPDAAATVFFGVHFSAATIRGQLLFEGGIHFVRKLEDSNNG